MKTQPDEATLTLWMDGELEGDELERINTWAQNHPEILAERDAICAMNASIQNSMPASIEPPYADFFNERILRHIHDESPVPAPKREAGFWQQFGRWLAIPAAAGAMAVCFYMGTRVGDGLDTAAPSYNVSAPSTVYTPDAEVSAAMFKSEGAGATIIVLEGLEDIPDDLEMVGMPSRSRSDHSGSVMVNSEITF